MRRRTTGDSICQRLSVSISFMRNWKWLPPRARATPPRRYFEKERGDQVDLFSTGSRQSASWIDGSQFSRAKIDHISGHICFIGPQCTWDHKSIDLMADLTIYVSDDHISDFQCTYIASRPELFRVPGRNLKKSWVC